MALQGRLNIPLIALRIFEVKTFDFIAICVSGDTRIRHGRTEVRDLLSRQSLIPSGCHLQKPNYPHG